MNLARKLAIALFLGMLIVLTVHANVRVHREVSLFENDIRHDSQAYGRALAAAVSEVFLVEGKTRALGIVENANQREGHVRIRRHAYFRTVFHDEGRRRRNGTWVIGRVWNRA